MSSGGKSSGQDSAARAIRALERGATTLGAQVARSLYVRWRRMPATRRASLEELAASVREKALDPHSGAVQRAPEREEVSELEVHDLRAELSLELERLAAADIRASRGSGRLAGEAPPSDGHV